MPALAHTRPRRVGAGSRLLRAARIIPSNRIMGVTLIAASLVIPPVVARLLTDRFAMMLVLSTAIGAAVAFAGMFVSYSADVASGASVVLLSAALFVATILYVTVRNWLRSGRLRIPTDNL